MSEKTKTPEEWKGIIGKIDDKVFEQLSYYLIRAMPGFVNPHIRDGSADGHRDIEAEWRMRAPDGLTELTESWRFECKKFSKGISFDDVSGKIRAAELNNVDKLVIMSNMHLTPACQDEIKKIQTNMHTRILDWTGIHFQDILFQHPNICKDFFPDEEIPSRILDIKKPEEIFNIPKEVGRIFGIEIDLKTAGLNFDANNPEESLSRIIKENIKEFEKLDKNIQSFIYQQFGSLFQILNRKEDSIYFVQKALEVLPQNISALLLKGYILEKLDELDQSDECYDKVLQIEKDNKFALNNKAHNLRRRGEYEEAMKLVDRALQIDPKFIIAINNKACIYKAEKEIDAAIKYLEKKIKDFPNSSILTLTMAQLHMEDLDFKRAFELNERLLKNEPNNVEVINNKGVIYERNSKYMHTKEKFEEYNRLAIQCFEKVTELDRNHAVGWSNITVCTLNLGNLKKAEEVLASVCDLFPTNSFILREKAVIEMSKKNPTIALTLFDKSLKYNFDIGVLVQKTQALDVVGRNKEMLDTTQQILRIDKKNELAWELKGKAHKRLHEGAKAGICFSNANKYKRSPKSLLE